MDRPSGGSGAAGHTSAAASASAASVAALKWSAVERLSRATTAANAAAAAAAGTHASPRKRRAQPLSASPAPPTPATVAAAVAAAAALNAPATGAVPAPQTASMPLHDPWSDAALPSLPRAQRLQALSVTLAASTAATAAGIAADAAAKQQTQLHARTLADAEPVKSNAPERSDSVGSAEAGAAPIATPPRPGRRARGVTPSVSDASPLVPAVPRRLAGARGAGAPGEPAGVSASFVALPRSNSAELRRKLSPAKPMSSVVSGFDATKMLLRAAAPNPNVYAIDLAAASTAASTAAAGHTHGGPTGALTARDPASELRSIRALARWFEAEWSSACAPDKADDSGADKAQQRLCERTFRELLLQVAAGQPLDGDGRRLGPVSARDVGTNAELERAHLLSHVVGEWHRVLQRSAHRRVDLVLADAEDAHARDQQQLRVSFQAKLDAVADELARGRVALDTLTRQNANQQLTLEHLHGRTDRDLLDTQRALTERDVTVTRLNNQIKVLENKLELAASERASLEAERAALQRERSAWHDEREQLQQLVRSQQQRMTGLVPMAYAVAQHQQLIDAAASGMSAGEAALLLALPPPPSAAAGDGTATATASGQQPSGVAQIMTIGAADKQGKGATGSSSGTGASASKRRSAERRRSRRKTGQSVASSSATHDTAGSALPGGGGGGGENIFAMEPGKRNAAALVIQSWCRGHMVRRRPDIQQLRARLPIATHAPTRGQAKAYAAARAAYAVAAAGAAAARARALQGSPLVSHRRATGQRTPTGGGGGGGKTPGGKGFAPNAPATAPAQQQSGAAAASAKGAQPALSSAPQQPQQKPSTKQQHRRQRSDSSADSAQSRPVSPRTMGARINERDAALAAAAVMHNSNSSGGSHSDVPAIPRFFTELMRGVGRHSGARRHFIRVSTRRNLLKWISQLFTEKLGSDQLLLQQQLQLRQQLAAGTSSGHAPLQQPPHQRMSFADFIYAYYVYRHGAKLPAEMDLLDLFASVERHRAHKRVAMFARFLNAELPYLRASPLSLLDAPTAAAATAKPSPPASAGGATATPAVGPLPSPPAPSPGPKPVSTGSPHSPDVDADKQQQPPPQQSPEEKTPAADDDADDDGGVLEPASPGNDASLASEPVTPAAHRTAAADAGTATDGKLPLAASPSKEALPAATATASGGSSGPPPLALNSPTKAIGSGGAAESLLSPQKALRSGTGAGAGSSKPVSPVRPASAVPAGSSSPPQRRPNTTEKTSATGTTATTATTTTTTTGSAEAAVQRGSGSVWLTRELQMELGVGLDGGSSLTARVIEFFTALLDAARVLGFGPTFNLTTAAADSDGACWVLARGVQQLFSRVFDRFPPAAVSAALARLTKLEVSKHTIKTLNTSAGGSDTKYVDFDAAAEIALDLYLVEDARLQDLLFVRYAVSTDSADADPQLTALGPKDRGTSSPGPAPTATTDPSSLLLSPQSSAYVNAAGGGGRRRLAATKFSLNHFTAVVHGMGLDWDDLHILRVYQQALQRRSDGRVRVDDFVYCLRAHGALPVRMHWDVLGTGTTAANGGNATTAPTPTAASIPLPLSVLMARNGGSGGGEAAAAAMELARLQARPLSPTANAAVAAMTGMGVVPAASPGGSGAGGAGLALPGRSMSLLHSGLADMRERMLELDTRWSHKVDALQSDHVRAIDRLRFSHDEQVRVLVRDTQARLHALEHKLETAEHTHAVEYNALFEDHLKEVQQLIAYYDKRDSAAAAAAAGAGGAKGADGKVKPHPPSAGLHHQRKVVPGAAAAAAAASAAPGTTGVTAAAANATATAGGASTSSGQFHATVTPAAPPPAIVTGAAATTTSAAAAAILGQITGAAASSTPTSGGAERARTGRLTPPAEHNNGSGSSGPDSPSRHSAAALAQALADGRSPPVGSTSSDAVNTLRRLLLRQETHAKVHVNAHASLRKQLDELKAKHATELRTLRDSNYFVRRVERERDDLKRAVDAHEKLSQKLRTDNDMLRKALLHAAERAGLGQDWVAQTLRMYVSSSPRHAAPRLSPFDGGASGSGGAEAGFGGHLHAPLNIHPHGAAGGAGSAGAAGGADGQSPTSAGMEIRLSPPPIPAPGRAGAGAGDSGTNAAVDHAIASAAHGAVSNTVASISASHAQHAPVRPSLFTFPKPGATAPAPGSVPGTTAAAAAAASAAAGADLHHHRTSGPATGGRVSQLRRGGRWRAAAAKARRSTYGGGVSAGGSVGATIVVPLPSRTAVPTPAAPLAISTIGGVPPPSTAPVGTATAAGSQHHTPSDPGSATSRGSSHRRSRSLTASERAAVASASTGAAALPAPVITAAPTVAAAALPSPPAHAAPALPAPSAAQLASKMAPALAAVSTLATATFASLLDAPHPHGRPAAAAPQLPDTGRAVTPGSEIDRLLQNTGVAMIRDAQQPALADAQSPKGRAAAALAVLNASAAAAVAGYGGGGAAGVGTPTGSGGVSAGGSSKSSPASDSPAAGRRRLPPSSRLSLSLQRANYAVAAATAAAAAAAVPSSVPLPAALTSAHVMTGFIPVPPLPAAASADGGAAAIDASAAAAAGQAAAVSTPTSAYTPESVTGLLEQRRASGTARPALAERDLFYESRRLSHGARAPSGRSLLS